MELDQLKKEVSTPRSSVSGLHRRYPPQNRTGHVEEATVLFVTVALLPLTNRWRPTVRTPSPSWRTWRPTTRSSKECRTTRTRTKETREAA